jgi:hypothetical protein
VASLECYGTRLRLIQLRATKRQSVGTLFLRNRPELKLLVLLDQKRQGFTLDVTVRSEMTQHRLSETLAGWW